MSYIGNTPTNQNFVAGSDQFNGTGSQTVFTLSRNVNTVFDIFVAISNVPQDPYNAYSVSGNTLTFTSAPPSGTGNIYVVYRATNVQTFVPSPGATVGGGFNVLGNVGIGTASPDANTLLTLSASSNNGITIQNSGDSNRGARLTVSGASASGTLAVNTTSSGYAITFGIDSNERARIDTSGNFKLSTAGTKILNSSGNPMLQQTGGVLQVVQSAVFDGVTTSSTSFQYSATTPTFTPTSASSSVLVLCAAAIFVDTDADSQGLNNGEATFQYQVGGTGGAWTTMGTFGIPGRGGNYTFTNAVFLISPATTSAIYFRVGVRKTEGSRVIQINSYMGTDRHFFLEIAG